jgi:hypothetical protein
VHEPSFSFDNSSARDLEGFYVPWQGARVPAPRMLRANRPMAAELGLDPGAPDSEAGAAILAGAESPAAPRRSPWPMPGFSGTRAGELRTVHDLLRHLTGEERTDAIEGRQRRRGGKLVSAGYSSDVRIREGRLRGDRSGYPRAHVLKCFKIAEMLVQRIVEPGPVPFGQHRVIELRQCFQDLSLRPQVPQESACPREDIRQAVAHRLNLVPGHHLVELSNPVFKHLDIRIDFVQMQFDQIREESARTIWAGIRLHAGEPVPDRIDILLACRDDTAFVDPDAHRDHVLGRAHAAIAHVHRLQQDHYSVRSHTDTRTRIFIGHRVDDQVVELCSARKKRTRFLVPNAPVQPARFGPEAMQVKKAGV